MASRACSRSSAAGGPPARRCGLSLRRTCLLRTGGSLAGRLRELGCEEIALGDTIEAGTLLAACRVVEATAHRVRSGASPCTSTTLAARHWPTSWLASGWGGLHHRHRDRGTGRLLLCARSERQRHDRGHRLSARGFGYCVFREIVEGIEVVDQIRKVLTKSRGRGPHQGVPVPRCYRERNGAHQ